MPKRTGRPFQRTKAAILKTSDVCHICGEPGADSVDHVIPIALGGSEHPSNLKPAHHNTRNSRGQRCNRSKGGRMHAQIVKRSGTLA